jgi:hypothetical protein
MLVKFFDKYKVRVRAEEAKIKQQKEHHSSDSSDDGESAEDLMESPPHIGLFDHKKIELV